MKRRLTFTLVITLLVVGCATNPVTGKRELALVGEAAELSIGKQQYLPAQQSQGGQYTIDQELTRYVREVGNRLAQVSDRQLPYEFVVLNNSTPNAWALPGGKIAVNRGLLMALENEAELAAVLGHEIVHAAARHGAKNMERSMMLQGALVLTAISARDSEYANYIMGGAQIGAQLINQRYGRGAEFESDEFGMSYMARAGYDPAAAISLQEKFVAIKSGNQTSWLEGLFSSHPPSQDRVARNRETTQTLKAELNKDWEIGEQRYARHMSMLRKRADAYEAFDQANALVASKDFDAALGRINKALSLERGEARFHGLKADIQFYKKQYNYAVRNYSDAMKLDDSYYEYYLGRGLARSRLGQRDGARIDLERSNQLLPTALATNELGTIALTAGDRHAAKHYFGQVAQTRGTLANAARKKYARLDLADNPQNYFATSAVNQQGLILITVQNLSGLDVKGAELVVSARINGKDRHQRLRSGNLAKEATTSVNTGWRVIATDIVENVQARVIRASL